MFVKKLDILKKPYLPPRIAFEEIEEEEKDWLLAGSDNSGGNGDFGDGGGDSNGDEDERDGDALDLDFSMDFVINDNSQL
ncbi:MAG: hypothetical protein J6W24_01560 [Prevotella sp.]|nr:hypothetical protein [Prevotella sp.]